MSLRDTVIKGKQHSVVVTNLIIVCNIKSALVFLMSTGYSDNRASPEIRLNVGVSDMVYTHTTKIENTNVCTYCVATFSFVNSLDDLPYYCIRPHVLQLKITAF